MTARPKSSLLDDITPAEAALLRVRMAEWVAEKARENDVSLLSASALREQVRLAEEAAFESLFGVASSGDESDTNGTI